MCVVCTLQFILHQNEANKSQRVTNINNHFVWVEIMEMYTPCHTLDGNIIDVVKQTQCVCWIYSCHEAYNIYFGIWKLSGWSTNFILVFFPSTPTNLTPPFWQNGKNSKSGRKMTSAKHSFMMMREYAGTVSIFGSWLSIHLINVYPFSEQNVYV